MLQRIFPNNEAMIERVIRVVAGLGVLSLAFIGPHSPFGYLGLILVATGAMGSCPLYTLFGFSTKRREARARVA
jgi:Na+/proline symporter